MSGGHFDYKEYWLDDIALSLQESINEAMSERPNKIKFKGISIYEELHPDEWCYMICPDFCTTDDAVKWLNVKHETGDIYVNESGHRYRISEYEYMDYPDREYRLELSSESIQVLKDTVKQLEDLFTKLHDIDYVLSGDSDEEILLKYIK